MSTTIVARSSANHEILKNGHTLVVTIRRDTDGRFHAVLGTLGNVDDLAFGSGDTLEAALSQLGLWPRLWTNDLVTPAIGRRMFG